MSGAIDFPRIARLKCAAHGERTVVRGGSRAWCTWELVGAGGVRLDNKQWRQQKPYRNVAVS